MSLKIGVGNYVGKPMANSRGKSRGKRGKINALWWGEAGSKGEQDLKKGTH